MLKLAICRDNTFSLLTGMIADALQKMCNSIEFIAVNSISRLDDVKISCPYTHRKINFADIRRTSKSEITFMLTCLPYDNNFFFEELEDNVIGSFSNWNVYTGLPVVNGVFYFLTSYVAKYYLNIGKRHEKTRGE